MSSALLEAIPARPVTSPAARPRALQIGATYVDELLARLDDADGRPVVIDGDRDISGRELRGTTFRYARALHLLGIGRGDLVALFAPNVPDALAVRYAAHVLGAASVYLPDPSSATTRADLLAEMDAQLLVVFPSTAELVPPGTATPVVAVGTDGPGGGIRLDDLAALQPSAPVVPLARAEDMAVIVSSGGTTGVPKGSWRTFAGYAAMLDGPSRPDRRQLVDGELAHLSQVLVDQTLLGGGTVVLASTCDPAVTLATIEAERITDLFLVEPQLADLVDHPDVATRDLSTLRTLVHIGASAPATLRRRARARLGPVVAHTYGASEIGVVSGLGPAEHDLTQPARFTCAGHIHPGVDVRFRRPDGTIARPGQPGEIEVRSPAVAAGYRNRPAEQAAAFRDGWFRTGDLGVLDDERFLHVLGRVADVVEIDGVLVTPTGIEDTLMRVAGVRIASVVVDHAARRWVAAVVAWPGTVVDPAACHAAVVAEHGVVAAEPVVIVPVDRIPLTGQGKPDRLHIAALAR